MPGLLPVGERAAPGRGLVGWVQAQRQRLVRREVRRWRVKNFFVQRWRELPLEGALLLVRFLQLFVAGLATPMHGRLYLKVVRGDGTALDLGMVGCHLVVTAGKNYVAACFDNTSEPELLKFHAFGTGTVAAAAGDTALGTEETTQYNPDNTRPTGSQAHATNTYTTIATYSPDSGATRAITEWGLLTQAATGGGTLFDRQVFTAVNLVAGSDSLQATYVLTQN
jgi:hypothetical protein